MSDTNRVKLSYAKTSAVAFPVTLSPNELTDLRYTGAPNLSFAPQTIASNEIRSDRQVSDLILVGAEAGGDVNVELSPRAFDDLIESALMSTFNRVPTKIGTSEITAFGAGTVTVDSAADFRIDMVIRLDNVNVVDPGEGVYVITNVVGAVITAAPWDANTNALSASMTAAADTSLRACGLQATAAGDFDIDVTSGVFTITAAGTSNFDDLMGAAVDLVPGQWLKLSNFDNAGNNIWIQIVSFGSTAITAVAQTGTLTEATTGKGVIWYGDYVRNGVDAVTAHQYLLEKRYEDHSPVTREAFLGMSVNNLTINLTPQQIATATFGFLGISSIVEETVSNVYSGGTPTDLEASAFDVFDSANDVGRLGRGTDPITAAGENYVLEATIQITNNMRQRNAVGVLGAVSIGAGEFTVTGNLNTYFDNKDILDQLLNNTETTFDVALVESDGRAMVFDMPRIKFSGGAPEVAGKNQDVVINLAYQAIRDATLNYTLQSQSFAYTE